MIRERLEVDSPCEYKPGAGLSAWLPGTLVSTDGRVSVVRDGRGTDHEVAARHVRAPKDTRPARRIAKLPPPAPVAEGEDAPELRPITTAKPSIVRTSIEGLHQRAPWRSPAYLAFVREHPCCVCQSEGPSDPHHYGPRGTGTKADDSMTVPLCREDHDHYHQHGIARGERDRTATAALFHRVQIVLFTAWIKRLEAPT